MSRPCETPRRGLTLVELLVVVAIISMLAAITIPLLAPDVDSRRTREAARGVSTFLASARAKAIETGRPAGVIIEPIKTNTAPVALTLYFCEEPPPFAGFGLNSRLTLNTVNHTTGEISATFSDGSVPATLVKANDMVQLNFQGPYYFIHSTTGSPVTSVVLRPLSAVSALPWKGGGSESVPYQIFRQPVASSAEPYQLPTGAVVDLNVGASDLRGSGSNAYDFGRAGNTVIMFAPNGAVDAIYHPTLGRLRPVSMLFLLIGKPDKAVDSTNWNDPTNLWVTINHQNGQTNVAEVSATEDPTDSDAIFDIRDSRMFARDRSAMGGK